MEPDLGIELFVLEAPTIEAHEPAPSKRWESSEGLTLVPIDEAIKINLIFSKNEQNTIEAR